MTVMVTGTDSMLGRELRPQLDAAFPGLTVYPQAHEPDLMDAEAVTHYLSENSVGTVVVCSGYENVDRAEDDRRRCAEVNVGIVEKLAVCAEAVGARVLLVSTYHVFDGNACRPYRESDHANPRDQYGTTKRQGETVLMAAAPQSIVVRAGWLYSPHCEGGYPASVLHDAAAGLPIKAPSDRFGTPTCASDLAAALCKIVGARHWVPGVYHYCAEGAASRYDYAKAVLRAAGLKGLVIPARAVECPTAAERPLNGLLDNRQIKATYGVETSDWVEALEAAVRRRNLPLTGDDETAAMPRDDEDGYSDWPPDHVTHGCRSKVECILHAFHK